eukprot:TRINITY_DN9695_c0_g1_i3.p1 TRINITY_DN9695_c0_g1~~TRINITY_DN9695_c0_g1_i3.p1  ORF type:complete len:575 (-),score=146.73 TRINITY_DN9695_c0_g1_i3:213-1904(-)
MMERTSMTSTVTSLGALDLLPSSPQANGKPLPVTVGDRVAIGATGLLGTVRFFGATEFAAGEWMGIELDDKAGKNDGSVKGRSYFTCQPEYGLFVRPTAVVKMGDVPRDSEDTISPPVSPAAREDTASGKAPSIKVEDTSKATPAHSEETSATTPTTKEGTVSPSTSSTITLKPRPSRTAEGEQILGLSKAQAQMELAQAMEDHDLEKIRRALPVATNLGVGEQEIEGARKIMDFEVQQQLLGEIDGVRGSVAHLTQTVVSAEARFEAAFQNKDALRQSNVSDWISGMREQLEKRVWQSLEKKIDKIVEGAVAKVSKQLRVQVEASELEAEARAQQQEAFAAEASKNAVEAAAIRASQSEKQQAARFSVHSLIDPSSRVLEMQQADEERAAEADRSGNKQAAARFSVANLIKSSTSRVLEMEQADEELAAKADRSGDKQASARFSVANLVSGAAKIEVEREKAAIEENGDTNLRRRKAEARGYLSMIYAGVGGFPDPAQHASSLELMQDQAIIEAELQKAREQAAIKIQSRARGNGARKRVSHQMRIRPSLRQSCRRLGSRRP